MMENILSTFLLRNDGETEKDYLCSQNLILVNATFDRDMNALHSMQLLTSFKMSLCMLLFMYVLYSLCRIAFNYK